VFGCKSEKNDLVFTNTPELFIEKLKDNFLKSDAESFNSLLIEKNDLVKILINENNKIAYQYSDEIFNIASDNSYYQKYRQQTIDVQKKISTRINRYTGAFQKAGYSVSESGIELKGILIFKRNYVKIDSIRFEAVKIKENWFLERLSLSNNENI
jgi:hypothetical protein